MTRSIPITCFVLAALLACESSPPPHGPPRTLTTHPHALDRYARLRIRELGDPDPVAVHRQVECEMGRLFTALGITEAEVRIITADDSIHQSPAARARFDSVEQKLQGKLFEGSGSLCDSLTKIANREDPIEPVDNAVKWTLPRTLETHPRALDRYTRLRLRELDAADPVAVRREVQCEMDRLFTAFGAMEGDMRMKTANDSIYRAPAARARFDVIDAKLQGRGFKVGEPWCQSLKATANREDPIAPVDETIRSP